MKVLLGIIIACIVGLVVLQQIEHADNVRLKLINGALRDDIEVLRLAWLGSLTINDIKRRNSIAKFALYGSMAADKIEQWSNEDIREYNKGIKEIIEKWRRSLR